MVLVERSTQSRERLQCRDRLEPVSEKKEEEETKILIPKQFLQISFQTFTYFNSNEIEFYLL